MLQIIPLLIHTHYARAFLVYKITRIHKRLPESKQYSMHIKKTLTTAAFLYKLIILNKH